MNSEPGLTSPQPVVLKWKTLSEAASEEDLSRRYGGIHFAVADTMGRKLGRLVATVSGVKA